MLFHVINASTWILLATVLLLSPTQQHLDREEQYEEPTRCDARHAVLTKNMSFRRETAGRWAYQPAVSLSMSIKNGGGEVT